ncbi:MAG TPA: hypothetical protein VKT78_15985 [Fimbriimonadaceae bacterium]|nr:hypothetical protein [Fimbriimonadaceae bacterium]
MRLKDIDNPWLLRGLPLMLGAFGMIVGTALAPLFVQLFNPEVSGTLDAYSDHHANWYANGAFIGLAVGLALAYGTLFMLHKHEVEEARGESKEPLEAH